MTALSSIDKTSRFPDADGAARSSWTTRRNNRLTESFDEIVPIPMTHEFRHKRLHIATVVKASRGGVTAMRWIGQRSFAVSDKKRRGCEAGDFGARRHKAKRPLEGGRCCRGWYL